MTEAEPSSISVRTVNEIVNEGQPVGVSQVNFRWDKNRILTEESVSICSWCHSQGYERVTDVTKRRTMRGKDTLFLVGTGYALHLYQ